MLTHEEMLELKKHFNQKHLWVDHKKRGWFVSWLFNRYRWFRRWCGGHWECWYNDLTKTDMWFEMSECTLPSGWRPPCCMGSPTCEDYK